MKFTTKIGLLFYIAIMLVVAGCSSVPLKFPTTLAKDVDMASGREITGKGCGAHILYFVPININGRYEDAYNELMERANKDKIANLRIEESWFYIYFGNVYCTKLKATAYPLLRVESAEIKGSVKKSVDERLSELKNLRDKNLITEDQEKSKRQEIIDDL